MLSAPSAPRPTALDAACVEHRDYVLGVLAVRCRWLEPCDREEMLHDAYVVLLEKQRDAAIDLDVMSVEQVRAYLTTTALYKALDDRKSAARRLSVPIDSDCAQSALVSRQLPVDEQVVVRAQADALRETVSGLPRRRRLVVGLRYFLDRSPHEVQRLLGVSERVYRRELERGTRALTDGVTEFA